MPIALLYGKTGNVIKEIHIDAAGDLQVDVLSIPLATDAATDLVLQAVRDRIGALTSPGSGSVNEQLASILTELKLGSTSLADQSGTVASSATWTNVLNVNGPGVLESLDFASNYEGSTLRTVVDGDSLELIHRTGASFTILHPAYLNELGGETAFWKQGLYDTGNNYFTMYLKQVLRYNATLAIDVRQESGVDKTIGVRALYRPIG